MARHPSRREVLQVAGTGLALGGIWPLLEACGGSPGNTPAAHSLDQLVIAQGSDATTMDVDFQSDTVTSSILYNMFDTLLKRGDDMKPQPQLAASYKALDNLTWELKLRPNVKFHNGEEFTSEAVAYSIARASDRKRSRQFSRFASIDKVAPVDSLTVRITTKYPYAAFPAVVMQDCAIVPPKYVEQVGDAGFNTHPIGTGPYKFVEWKKDDHVAMEANDAYWGGKPKFRKVIFRPIKEDSSRLAALKAGEVDLVTNVPPDQVAPLDKASKYEVRKVPSARVIYMGIQTFRPPFDNLQLRQALNYAVDVDSIIKDLLLGHGYRTATPLTKMHLGYDASIKPYPFDPAKARQLLAAAGFPNGLDTVINTPFGRFIKDKEVAEAIGGQLVKVGIRAKVIPDDFSVFLQKYDAKKFDGLYLQSWGNSSFDADYTLTPLFSSRGRGYYYKNTNVDAAIDKAGAELDQQKRVQYYSNALKVIYEDAPWVFLYEQQDLYGVARSVKWQPRSDEAVLAVQASA
jgi:peptide/nickel transport system substrate-binding protein